jgi:hypothetical protein
MVLSDKNRTMVISRNIIFLIKKGMARKDSRKHVRSEGYGISNRHYVQGWKREKTSCCQKVSSSCPLVLLIRAIPE